MGRQKCKVTVRRAGPSISAKNISLAVIRRDQAPEEQRRFKAAADALLLELVRDQMGRKGNQHG